MSRIVLVHGIGQELESADALEAAWLPALAGGIRIAGHPATADRVWRGARPGEDECRMAFYGDLFRASGQMGGGAERVAALTPEQQELAQALALEWLRSARDRAPGPEDRAEAGRRLRALDTAGTGRMGSREAGRRPLNGLARLRWFAPAGMAFAQTFVERALVQVTRYLTEEPLREEIQGRVAALVGTETVALVGHSLGSVVAFQAAHRLNRELPLLLTLGSPLGLRTVVYDRLPQPRAVPATTRRWVNLADRDDLAAALLDLAELFADPYDALESDWTVDNGAQPHRAESYLHTRQAGSALAAVLG
ncbi:hypothetical protein [Streptomyces katsurahamanus]|uniref:Alpha/beta hydrolase n=1 Tax=Streptomyces katsurahamanus TaxID=2577098 RepID=A0ABW9NMD0_9ACTN|nr:hypothetical protein [Streptomyces katsurahamanus]MQS34418.1 hypothetical protein [Streptomyces katsurahamanus]